MKVLLDPYIDENASYYKSRGQVCDLKILRLIILQVNVLDLVDWVCAKEEKINLKENGGKVYVFSSKV